MNSVWKIASAGAVLMVAACVSHTREVVREQPIVQQEPERTVIVNPPAAPVETIPPAPAATGYTWKGGHYDWRDGRWVWIPGQWVVSTR
jgi:hypothetical protein